MEQPIQLKHTHEERIIKLETRDEFQEKTLDKIEKQVDKIVEDVSEIKQAFNEHNGEMAAKGRIHKHVYMWLSFLVLLVGNDVFWNYIGK